jgi:hypothetical protein
MLKLNVQLVVGIAVVGIGLAAVTLPFASQADTQTSNTSVDLVINPVISSYSSGPTVTLGAITPDITGKQSTGSDTVTAATNDTAGLTMTLSENSAASTSLISGANNITIGSGAPAAPATLTNGTWGWRIDSLAGFGAGPTSVISNAAPSAITYAPIPANGAPFTIATSASTGTTTKTVWYSARVNNTQPIGTYASTVTYTITTN